MLMSVCLTVSVLRFYGCYHPCFDKNVEVLGKKLNCIPKIFIVNRLELIVELARLC